MKYLILLICLLMAIETISAQITQPDLTTGKYLEMPNKNKYKKKSWSAKTDESQLSVDIDIVKKDVKNKDVNFSTDAFQLKVKKLMVNGENIAAKFKEDIDILVMPNTKDYKGYYTDPVTNNILIITIKYIAEDQLVFTDRVSNDPRNDRKKGTLFPGRTITLEKNRSLKN